MSERLGKILVVDDSQVIRDLLSEYLTDRGHEVETAVDGLDGIEKALANDYDLIFCDLHMPRRNGFQVYSAVTEAKPQTQFVMTDSLPDELAAQAEAAGACCCLTKPFDLNEVSDTVQQILRTAEKECPKSATKTSA